MKKFCAILNLKFQIFQNNVDKTYDCLQECTDLPKCCGEIFESKNIGKLTVLDNRISNVLK